MIKSLSYTVGFAVLFSLSLIAAFHLGGAASSGTSSAYASPPVAFHDSAAPMIVDAGTGSAVVVIDAAAAPAGSGSGSMPPALPDPIDHPGESLAAAHSDVSVYGWLWGGMIIVIGVVSSLAKRNDEDHFVHNRYALALLVGVPTVGTALLLWHFANGATGAMLGTVLAALLAVWQKPAPKAAA